MTFAARAFVLSTHYLLPAPLNPRLFSCLIIFVDLNSERVRAMLRHGLLHELTYVAIDPLIDPKVTQGRDDSLPDQHLLGSVLIRVRVSVN